MDEQSYHRTRSCEDGPPARVEGNAQTDEGVEPRGASVPSEVNKTQWLDGQYRPKSECTRPTVLGMRTKKYAAWANLHSTLCDE